MADGRFLYCKIGRQNVIKFCEEVKNFSIPTRKKKRFQTNSFFLLAWICVDVAPRCHFCETSLFAQPCCEKTFHLLLQPT